MTGRRDATAPAPPLGTSRRVPGEGRAPVVHCDRWPTPPPSTSPSPGRAAATPPRTTTASHAGRRRSPSSPRWSSTSGCPRRSSSGRRWLLPVPRGRPARPAAHRRSRPHPARHQGAPGRVDPAHRPAQPGDRWPRSCCWCTTSCAAVTSVASNLIYSAIALWGTNVIIYGLWYWELDGGGPNARHDRARPRPRLPLPAAGGAGGVREAVAPVVLRLPLPVVHQLHRRSAPPTPCR